MIIEANDLGKRYGRKRALAECTLAIPAGKVVGLVGPNGAGKTTLLHLCVGLLQPSAGSISVLGGRPGTTPTQLARVGFVAQDTPTRAGFSSSRKTGIRLAFHPKTSPAIRHCRRSCLASTFLRS